MYHSQLKKWRELAEKYPLNSVEDKIILENLERIESADLDEWLSRMDDWADFWEGEK